MLVYVSVCLSVCPVFPFCLTSCLLACCKCCVCMMLVKLPVCVCVCLGMLPVCVCVCACMLEGVLELIVAIVDSDADRCGG